MPGMKGEKGIDCDVRLGELQQEVVELKQNFQSLIFMIYRFIFVMNYIQLQGIIRYLKHLTLKLKN